MKRPRRSPFRPVVHALFLLALAPASAGAQQQFQGLCAVAKIEIQQQLTIERIGFLATLELTNNEADADITDFSATLTFENPELSEEGSPHDASGLFFVQPPEIEGTTGIDGSGVIPAQKTIVVRWFIIPKIEAGGTDPRGIDYNVGVELAGSLNGNPISPEILEVYPDEINVRPEPQLEITYFQPRDVMGDDPFTPEIVESPVPFTLGVLVRNAGYGLARQVKIESEQPRIVENELGLLLVAQLIGSRVDDLPTDRTSLTVNLGDIEPGKCRKGAWDMITTLSGEFIEFNASYTHASELGGQETSVIRSIDAFFIAREVLNDQPGRDDLLDFLADTDDDPERVPDALYESDCNVLPVNRLLGADAVGGPSGTVVRATADREDWVYIRVRDPAQAKLAIARVTRSDGRVLHPRNVWTNVRFDRATNARLAFLNIFDFVALGEYEYTVEYEGAEPDLDPPVTSIEFAGASSESGGVFFVLPETQVFFLVEDASPVGTFYRLDGTGDFRPAFPFTIDEGGEHTVEYFSRDSEGNEEAVRTATVIVSADPPGIGSFTFDTGELFSSGDAISVRPSSVEVAFEGVLTASRLDAELEVFSGVLGWPTVEDVPSSPTSGTEAVITVGGENVDFYRYRVNDGEWSAEVPVDDPITLSSLAPGTVELRVNGRSRHGDYLPEEDAVLVSFVVDPAAAPTTVAGTPPTPSRGTSAELRVSGVDEYRWTIDGGFYRAPAPASEPIRLERLDEGVHTVSVIGRTGGGEWQDESEATRVTWTVDRGWGFDLSGLARVRRETFEDIGTDPRTFTWDGRDDDGATLPSGWYTVRLTVRDELGRATSAVSLVRLGDLASGAELLSDAGAARQKRPHAAGRWVVWQDQRSGNWDILAFDLLGGGAPLVVTASPTSQERPRTDGRWVVWEDRQPDGSWDVRARELGSVDPPVVVTSTPELDEKEPVVDWPWVVYQRRAVGSSEPWQLEAHDLRTGESRPVDPTTQDQTDAALHGGLLAWRDLRDPGNGEIYLADLEDPAAGSVRLTADLFGQFDPSVHGSWIVWTDARNGHLDLYGRNLFQPRARRLTSSAENETRPQVNGSWVVYEEDSGSVLENDLRLLSLANLETVQLTNALTEKRHPSLASGSVVWEERREATDVIVISPLPSLQPVWKNNNAVVVTRSLADRLGDASSLLALWNRRAEVSSLTRYTELSPAPVAETLSWDGGIPSGVDFSLEEGGFVWAPFDGRYILELGDAASSAVDLRGGVNAVSHTSFPDGYTAYRALRELEARGARAIRALDASTGEWRTAVLDGASLLGDDFEIPRVSVLFLEMDRESAGWTPGSE